MNIIGVDASLTGTGVALVFVPNFARSIKDCRAHTFTVASNPEHAPVLRYRQIAARVFGAIRGWEPADSVAVMEAQYVPGGRATSAGALLLIAQLRGVLLYGLDSRGVPVAEPLPAAVKRWGTGRGNANKAEMLASARRSLAEFECSNHNEADAAWMAWLGVRYYHPRVQPVHREVFNAADTTGVRWPHRENGAE